MLNSHKNNGNFSAQLKIKWVLAISIYCLLLSANSFSENGAPANLEKNPVSDKDQQTITIQVISHKKAAYAERELERLKSHGLDAIISLEPVNDKGMFYRIYVGQFENRKTALAFASGLVDKGIISGFWIKKTTAFVQTAKFPIAKQNEINKSTIEAQQPKEKIEAAIKEPPPPPIQIETPVMEAPPETREPKKADASEIAESPGGPVVQKETAPSEIQEPEKADTLDSGDVLPDTIVRKKEAAPAISIGTAAKDQKKSRLSLGIKSSLSFSKKADDFKITQTSGNTINTWKFEDTHKYGGLVANFQLTDRFAIESDIERGLFTKLELWQLSIGPTFQFPQMGNLTPYISGGLIVGDLKWDDAPGDFDTGIGWEGGVGIYLIKSKIKIGFETSYQQMNYTYNTPSGQEVSSTYDRLDLSGYALSAALSYLF